MNNQVKNFGSCLPVSYRYPKLSVYMLYHYSFISSSLRLAIIVIYFGRFERFNGHYIHFYKNNKLTTNYYIYFCSMQVREQNNLLCYCGYIVISKSQKCVSFQSKAIHPLPPPASPPPKKKQTNKQTLWSLFMDGVQLPQG